MVTMITQVHEPEIDEGTSGDYEFPEFLTAMRKARNRAYASLRIPLHHLRNNDFVYVGGVLYNFGKADDLTGASPDTRARRKLVEAARRELDKWEKRL